MNESFSKMASAAKVLEDAIERLRAVAELGRDARGMATSAGFNEIGHVVTLGVGHAKIAIEQYVKALRRIQNEMGCSADGDGHADRQGHEDEARGL